MADLVIEVTVALNLEQRDRSNVSLPAQGLGTHSLP